MKKLYRFYWDCGRQGCVEGIFVEDDQVVKAAMGKSVYFGEILGKHSEVVGELDDEDLTVVTADPAVINIFEEFKLGSGYNPLDYIGEE